MLTLEQLTIERENATAILNHYKANAESLRVEIKSLEGRLEQAKSELRDMAGDTFSRGKGKIGQFTSKIASIDHKITQVQSLPVVWMKDQRDDYIVVKVTPKRITVQKFGYNGNKDQYNRDGTPVSSWYSNSINLLATFGPDYKVDKPFDVKAAMKESTHG